jgi:hypothetical protein
MSQASQENIDTGCMYGKLVAGAIFVLKRKLDML